MRRALVAALAAGLLALSACGGGGGAGEVAFSGVTHDAYHVPATSLTDTDGSPYSLTEDTKKPLTLVFFGYTHCPDICPMVMSSLTSAMTRLKKADREKVDVVFVTTDPARDTAGVLRKYLDRYDPSFIGLTGDLQTIVDVAKPLAIYVADGTKLPSGGYDLNTHSTQVSAIGSDDTSTVLWDMDTSSAQFAADVQALLHGKAPQE
ncbi:protein SCO1/2 [Nocardioides terrae]|uniref:Protein SCO1/2 n=1 Tax=Nocardioides terrae TaxID=574651 RepID=A0A1I1FWK5_9ACTN|nr:SCO family protein [Nocardioides terrae]SFC03412.1 protein SCO1/2 [Nocardioides terrae]